MYSVKHIESMEKNMWATAIIVVILATTLVGYFSFSGEKRLDEIDTAPVTAEIISDNEIELAPSIEEIRAGSNRALDDDLEQATIPVEATTSPNIKEFDMTARKWTFEPSTITVNKGDTVILHITSIDVTHGFLLPTFGINEELNPGKTVDIEFVANKAGTFVFACNVFCGSGHGRMNGKLIVQ